MILGACSKNSNGSMSGNPVLLGVVFPDLFQKAVINGDTAIIYLPYGSPVTAIRTHIETASTTTVSVDRNGILNFSQPLSITLTENNTSKRYVIKVVVSAVPETTVRGVWVTNVGSPALSSPQNIDAMVNDVVAAGMNVVFIDVFNKNQTLHPSNILKQNVPPNTQTQIFGPGWDPLQVVIDKAHAKNIKVIPWFEYGFISHYAGIAHPILDAHPDWVAIDYNNAPAVRNSFTWLNGFDPQVQQFMIDLIMEVVNKYDVDGIQCDDHLPSMPVNSGYDANTAALYKTETGKNAPFDNVDPGWVQWRADKLTIVAEKIYRAVKAAKPHCAVSFAPGPLGWSLQNNLADWETWVKKNIYDMMSPLLYRSEGAGLSSYTDLVDKDVTYILNKYPGSSKKYFPGILVKTTNYAPSDNYLAACLNYNRSKNITGEVIWYYDGIKSNVNVYKALYPGTAVFPVY